MSTAASSPVEGGSQRRGIVLSGILCLMIGLFVGHFVTYHLMSRHHGMTFPTQYQAVLLSNGAVYYGKLAGYGTRNPVLSDVFYIVTKTDPETKQVSNLLVKRGKELHGPDRMYINASQIVMVEPVGADSKVAQLITEADR
ncbi:MAG TPA: hypothetical protein VKB58_15825 [Terriglobales bacterium]|nr:hypothetical protein [Terriglobales bacterium]